MRYTGANGGRKLQMEIKKSWQIAKPARSDRPDLSRKSLLVLALVVAIIMVIFVILGRGHRPGEPLGQISAIVGSLLLLVPLAFFIAKRSGLAASPPLWFVAHALSGFGGIALIAYHVASVSKLSFALVPLAALIFLVIQGFWVRAFLTQRLSTLFARSPRSFQYGRALADNKGKIAEIIAKKKVLLAILDPSASEATFSPRLSHWFRAPIKTLRYERLANNEALLVGAKSRAGFWLSYSRRFHMAVAAMFYLSLLAHVVVMLFFAGYAAQGEEVYWWHFTSWGGENK